MTSSQHLISVNGESILLECGLYQGSQPEKLKSIFLVHGEQEQAEPLRRALEKNGFSEEHIPVPNQSFSI